MAPPCLVCGSAQADTVFSYSEPDPYEVAAGITKENYYRRWMRCAPCGFYYSAYSRQPGQLAKLYESAYRGGDASWRRASPEKVFRDVIALPKEQSETHCRVQWIKSQIDRIWTAGIVTKGSPPYRVMDIGGATGVFAYQFQDENWKAYVIDPDENGQFIESQLKIPFVRKQYEPKSFPFTFDLISLVFVLEHIEDPVAVLRKVRCDMGPHSLLYIEVPSDLAFKLKSPGDDIFNSCHLWMFGPESMVRILSSCGFRAFALECTQTRRGHYSLMSIAGLA